MSELQEATPELIQRLIREARLHRVFLARIDAWRRAGAVPACTTLRAIGWLSSARPLDRLAAVGPGSRSLESFNGAHLAAALAAGRVSRTHYVQLQSRLNNCGVDAWGDLDQDERNVWNALAEAIGFVTHVS